MARRAPETGMAAHAVVSAAWLVEHAERYVRGQAGRRVPLSQLCHKLGVSERTLRNAFYRLRGVSPTRSLRADRLSGARRALETPRSGDTTVTRVATRFGFYELGRFAAAYRQAFGETPSATLRAAGTQAAP